MYVMRLLFMILTLVVFALTTLPTTKAFPQTEWIVDDSVPAYDTLRKALLAARAGDVIKIMPGNYTDAVVLDKRVDLVAEPGVKLGPVDVHVSDVALSSFDSEGIRIGPNVNDIKMDNIATASLTIESANNIEMTDVRGMSITANNVTNLLMTRVYGSLSATTIRKLDYYDSTGGYTVNGDDITLSNVRGTGSISGSKISVLGASGTLSVTGSDTEVVYSTLSGLAVDGANSVVASNQLSNSITLRGNAVVFHDNIIRNFATFDVSASNSSIYNNTFVNKLGSDRVSETSSPDIILQGGVTFVDNSIETFRGILVGACETTLKSNNLFLTRIPKSFYSQWNQTQEASQAAGLKVTGTCEEGKTNRIVLNKIHGFKIGVAIESSNNDFRINEVESNSTNIKVIGNNNVLLRNNFLGNATAIDDGIGNQWFVDINPSTEEGTGGGNYWDRWRENDVDSDGIIDTPFVLEGKGDRAIDMLPFVEALPLVDEQVVVPEFGAIAGTVVLLSVTGAILGSSWMRSNRFLRK